MRAPAQSGLVFRGTGVQRGPLPAAGSALGRNRGLPRWLLVLLALLALIAAMLLLLPDAEEPDSPSVSAPKAPSVEFGRPHLPAVGKPSVGTHVPVPDASGPRRTSPTGRTNVVPGLSADQTRASATEGAEPTVIRHTELIHDHHRRYTWRFSLSGLALVALFLGIIYALVRRPGEGRRRFAAFLAAGTLGLATAAFITGIDAAPGAGTYDREPPDVERSTNAQGVPVIDRSIHEHHRHGPIYLDAPFLLLGLGLSLLSVPNARIALRPRRADNGLAGDPHDGGDPT